MITRRIGNRNYAVHPASYARTKENIALLGRITTRREMRQDWLRRLRLAWRRGEMTPEELERIVPIKPERMFVLGQGSDFKDVA